MNTIRYCYAGGKQPDLLIVNDKDRHRFYDHIIMLVRIVSTV